VSRPHAGRTALVTGAAAGLGQAYALRLAAQGARIVVADVAPADDTVKLIEADGGEAVGLVTDVANPASVATLAERIAELGGVDICVNNAGITGQTLVVDGGLVRA
jgi:NAD(P)-dependent dehydrogenase (short-subunit alcohol dehydrogenase family)